MEFEKSLLIWVLIITLDQQPGGWHTNPGPVPIPRRSVLLANHDQTVPGTLRPPRSRTEFRELDTQIPKSAAV